MIRARRLVGLSAAGIRKSRTSSCGYLGLRAALGTQQNAGRCRDFSVRPTAITSAPNSMGPDAKGWIPETETSAALKQMAHHSLMHQLIMKHQSTDEAVVKWFLANMPQTYFRATREDVRLDHLQAVSAIIDPSFFTDATGSEPAASTTAPPSVRDISLRLQRISPDGSKEATVITPLKGTGGNGNSTAAAKGLLAVLGTLPRADGLLSQVKVFTSRDKLLSIDVFNYQSPNKSVSSRSRATAADAPDLMKYAEKLLSGEIQASGAVHPATFMESKALEDYLSRCEREYVKSSNPRRFLLHRSLYEQVSGTECVAVNIEPYEGVDVPHTHPGPQLLWVTAALANVLPKVALSLSLRLLQYHGAHAIRCHMDLVDDPGNGTVTMLRVLVEPSVEATDKWLSRDTWTQVSAEMTRLKWLDERVLAMALDTHKWMDLELAEITCALAGLVQGVLYKSNPWAFSRAQIQQWLDDPRLARHAQAISMLFRDRFRPPAAGESVLSDAEFGARVAQINNAVRREVEVTEAKELLAAMAEAVCSTRRTNLFMPDRYALSLRVEPKLLMSPAEIADPDKEVPFGVFYVYGRRFVGFHCRFRDIARGGLRIVTPGTAGLVAQESARQFDEAYGLAYAQQLKNKDIPEGGAKGVVLVDTIKCSSRGKIFAMRKCVKAMTDALLDLIVDTEKTRAGVVDFLGRKELLYLGPDEQVVPADIDWIVAQAGRRGLAAPMAFMSSKPKAGFNHKEFGVTSEGVFVFLDVALRQRGLNPREGRPFTIMLTGGPDGDVAGNMVRILVREYGAAARVVGMADGSGCAEDPNGLDHTELMRLVDAALPIAAFNPSCLSPDGVLHDTSAEAGIQARNTMHFRVPADVFVPAGGRPGTINEDNWRLYLSREGGQPASPLIVEGANLFVTPVARQKLWEEAGVTIVKDSSANKCGVICSSYEVAVAMLLEEEEFFSNKTQIVTDVLDRLRAIARREAELLFREQTRSPAPLPKCSERVSLAINQVADAVAKELEAATPEELARYTTLLLPMFREHLPKSLADMAFDRVQERMPEAYLLIAMAKCLAANIVYVEGVAFVSSQPASRLGKVALKYAESASHVEGLAKALADGVANEEQRREAIELLRTGGARANLGVF